MSNKTPTVNLDLMSAGERAHYEALDPKQQAEYIGYGESTRPAFDVPQYITNHNEKVIKKNGSFIVLGLDRTNSILSQRRETHAAAIDLVVGRKSFLGRRRNAKGKLMNVDPDMTLDAARVYISQKCNIDGELGLSAPRYTTDESPRSTVALKADTIRLVGRENIKIVTRTDQFNSQGGEVSNLSTKDFGIDLIALNDTTSLQPLVKGDNLQACLNAIVDSINELRGLFNNFVEADRTISRSLINHAHYGTFFGGRTSLDFENLPPNIQSLIDKVTDVTAQLPLHASKTALIKTNYLGAVQVADTVDPFDLVLSEDQGQINPALNVLSKYNSTN